MTPQQKSAVTRVRRNTFRKAFGPTTYHVVTRLLRGDDTTSIATSLGLSVRSVATWRGNLNRGSYDTYLNVSNVQGSVMRSL